MKRLSFQQEMDMAGGEENAHLLEELSVKEAHLDDDRISGSNNRPTKLAQKHSRWPAIRHAIAQGAFFCIPSFIQLRLRPQPAKPVKLHPTAYLDGMRGLAALFVFFYHLSYSSHDVFTAYGAYGDHHEFLKLPMIRFIYTGPAMVAIFYVVSGYALSYKPVRLMRSRNWSELMHTISSSIFRRAIRLYLPCIISTLLIVTLVRLGIYEWTRPIANDERLLNEARETHLHHFDTLGEQLADWAGKMWIFIHPWSFGTKDTDIDIDRHLWTIPMEFRSSLVLYLTQAGTARLVPRLRLASLIALIVWCYFKDRWEMILFYSGFAFAELDFMRAAGAAAASSFDSLSLPVVAAADGNNIIGRSGTVFAILANKALLRFTNIRPSRKRGLTNTFWLLVFLAGIYLCSQPQRGADDPSALGWQTLTLAIPEFVAHKQRFWVSWGAILLVWATSNARFLQRIFTNAPVQYLGRISFSLYLMHGPVTHTIGYGAMDILWKQSVLGTETWAIKEVGFAIAAVIDIAATVVVGDFFMRAVDIPVVKFAKWVEGKCVVKID